MATALVTTSVAIGFCCITAVRNLIRENNNKCLKHSCVNSINYINTLLDKVQKTVEFLYEDLDERISDPFKLSDKEYREDFCRRVEKVFLPIANKTESLVSIYLRFTPELTDSKAGFFYIKRALDSPLEKRETSDILFYKENNPQYLVWFYYPLESKKPVWIDPYLDTKVSGEKIISYVIPIIKNGIEVGVIGADVDFNSIVKASSFFKDVEHSGARIFDSSENLAYLSKKFNDISLKSEKKDLFLFKETLLNGMTLELTAIPANVTAESAGIIVKMIVLTLIIIFVYILITVFLVKSIIKPLNKLNRLAMNVAAGNLDVESIDKSDDEIGKLINSFTLSVGRLKNSIEITNSRALTDSLTGVKNKAAYDSAIKNINSAVQNGSLKNFAIVVFDCNNLKLINDTYGHECGNIFLKNCSAFICRIFSHSPVFRIGGDEFVTILQNEDFNDRNELVADFEKMMTIIVHGKHLPYEDVSIAMGMADFDVKIDFSAETVFKRADKAMYENKKQMKNDLCSPPHNCEVAGFDLTE